MSNQNFFYSEYPQKGYSEKLKPISQLLKESWRIFCLKIKILLGIIGLPIGFSFLFWILMYFLAGTSIKYSIWFSVIGTISYLSSLFFWLWAIPSLLYNLKEDAGIKESYKRGFKILGSYIWVYFLLTIIIAGGFLLFIIPGILFSIWFSLAIFILVFEKRKGFNALFKSKHLVKGKFWGVLGRFLVLGLIIGLGLFLIFALIIFGIENKKIESQISEAMGYFIQLFVLPFFLIYGFLIYNNLKEIKAEIPYEEPPPSKKIKYVIPGILGILIVGLLISFSFFNVFLGRDEPPTDDRDLWLSKIEIPKEENAFYPLTQAGEKIYLPKEKFELFRKMVEGEKWDSEFAEELIKNNEEVFRYFEKAIELPYFQIPEFQDPKTIGHETIIPGMSGLRNMAKLNSVKASYLLTQGKEKEALDLIVKTIKMGQIIEDSPRPVLISYLVGMAIKETGLQRLRMMIPNLTLSSEILKNYVAELDQFKANEEGLIRAMKMEYIISTDIKSKIDAAFVGELSGEELEKLGTKETSFEIKAATKLNYLYKPNQTQRIFAEYYRNFVDNVNKDCNEIKWLEIKHLAPYSKIKIIKMLFTENVVGKILHDDIVAVSFSGFFDKKCLEDFSVIGTQSLIAIRAYQIDTGKIPSYLDELVPKYFSEVPRDPFDGKLIKYSPEKKIIYSVGEDLKDSGGSEGKDWRTMEDPTFRIEF
jgi:hypothetical protein